MRSDEWWDARKARVLKNEESFREYNNRRMQFEPVDADDDEELIPFICECGDFKCIQALLATAAEYSDAHSTPDRFMVLPGHVFAEIERIVSSHERFEVVEKPDMDVDAEW